MRFLHTADLHIGKVMYEFSLEEDQNFILNEILKVAKEREVDALLLAGDIFDRSVPTAEAMQLFDSFLNRCVEMELKVLLVSGNHDSPKRLAYGSSLFKQNGLHFATFPKEQIERITLKDDFGVVNFYLLPFFKPSYFSLGSEAEATGAVIKKTMEADFQEEERNVLLTHYFVGDKGKMPELSDSENPAYVGGLDLVPASLFEAFDYTALGHIHKAQKVGGGNIYYSGTPLAYSFSEAGRQKSIQLVELKEKGSLTIEAIPLTPLKEVRVIKGDLWELIKEEVVSLSNKEDYIKAVLTNKEALLDPMSILRSVYPNVMEIEIEQQLFKSTDFSIEGTQERNKSPLALLLDFFEFVYDEPMEEELKELAAALLKEVSL